jgi:hypothetical protein
MKSISVRDLARVADYPEQINDLRQTTYGNIRHKLVDIIIMAFRSVMCDYEDYGKMEEFGKLRLDFLKGFLELPNEIPDELGFWRILGCLAPPELQRGLENRLADVKTWTKGENKKVRLVNTGRKTIWGSGFHVVSV